MAKNRSYIFYVLQMELASQFVKMNIVLRKLIFFSLIQALLYRLSGDYNPLHSDPDIAQVAGYAPSICNTVFVFFFILFDIE